MEDFHKLVRKASVSRLVRLWIHLSQLFFQELEYPLHIVNLIGIRKDKTQHIVENFLNDHLP